MGTERLDAGSPAGAQQTVLARPSGRAGDTVKQTGGHLARVRCDLDNILLLQKLLQIAALPRVCGFLC